MNVVSVERLEGHKCFSVGIQVGDGQVRTLGFLHDRDGWTEQTAREALDLCAALLRTVGLEFEAKLHDLAAASWYARGLVENSKKVKTFIQQ